MSYTKSVPFESLVGKTITSISVNTCHDELRLTADGVDYLMFHIQDCCESVALEGANIEEIQALIGSPIVVAEESTSEELQPGQEHGGSNFMWTFYKLRTAKADVTLRWYGSSDYYSVSVDFVQV